MAVSIRTVFAVIGVAVAACAPASAQDGGPDYTDEEMRAAREALYRQVGGQVTSMVMADRFEHRDDGNESIALWDADAWIGNDLNKFWLKTEGEYHEDESVLEAANVQLLYSRAILPHFDLQVGYRNDFEPGPSQHFAVVGLEGLAPYWFEVDASVYISDEGDLFATLESEYELLLTQRLVLQPRMELNFATQGVPDRGATAGLTSAEAGARLRYEFLREVAPYIGVSWEGAFGGSADLRRLTGEDISATSFVAGLRWWF